MNTYRITFTRENGSQGTDRFVAATEAQARRDFRECYRHGNGSIISVELVSTNTPTTKDQERKAAEKIRKIIEELGPGSYVGTALEGCLDDAESNIDNDFGDSMKRRWEYAEEQLKEARKEIASLKSKLADSEKDYEAAHAAAHEIAEQKDSEIAVLRQRTLSPDDITDIANLLAGKVSCMEADIKGAAQQIVDLAENPDGVDFHNAVMNHRAFKSGLDYYRTLLSRVISVKNAN